MKRFILFVVVLSYVSGYGQVGINTDGSDPDGSAMLDVKSTTMGILLPRMTQTQIEGIISPANGLVVFCTTDNKFYVFRQTGNEWKEIAYGAGILQPACGTPLYDSRDGKSYTTVLIGTQCWMAENLNIGTKINGSGNQTDNGVIEKYCIVDLESYCNIYGGLYQWNEMMQYVSDEGVQGICPTGWHIPTDSEWINLVTFLSGESVAGGKMKEAGVTHWNSPNTGATNESGFTALGGGARNNGSFIYLNLYVYFWSSSEYSSAEAWMQYLGYNYTDAHRGSSYKTSGFSCRCIQD